MQSAHLTRSLFNVTEYGAAGDGQAADTAAIQAALDACGRAGGGTVYLPAGSYVSGSIFLRDRTSLYLEAGATILGSHRAEDYPVVDSRWEGADQQTHASLISGEGLSDIAVAGRGVVDGRGAPWWKLHREHRLTHPRPRLISFTRCRNVLIEGITATN
jgi:polygalacturonase